MFRFDFSLAILAIPVIVASVFEARVNTIASDEIIAARSQSSLVEE